MIIIEIAETETTNFFSEKSKKTFYKQRAYMHKTAKNQKHPDPVTLFLGEQNAPYPVGLFELDDDSFYPDRFNSVTVNCKLVATDIKLPKAA